MTRPEVAPLVTGEQMNAGPEPSGRILTAADPAVSARIATGIQPIRAEVPWWIWFLERFGFPTIVAGALGWMLFHMIEVERQTHEREQGMTQKAFEQSNETLSKLTAQSAEQGRTLSEIKTLLAEDSRRRGR